MNTIDLLRYPIGQFSPPSPITAKHVRGWIDEIARFPGDLRRIVEPLTDTQLDTPYRPDGWTVRQVVHHVGDSHLCSYVRFKWAITEDRPLIKAYHEALWAQLHDYRDVPVELALDFLDALHRKWVIFLRGLGPAELAREFVHPEIGVVRVDENVGIYAWHGRHHLAHITRLAGREGW